MEVKKNSLLSNLEEEAKIGAKLKLKLEQSAKSHVEIEQESKAEEKRAVEWRFVIEDNLTKMKKLVFLFFCN